VRTESDIYVFLVIMRYDLVVCIQTFPNLALLRVLSKTQIVGRCQEWSNSLNIEIKMKQNTLSEQ
jgi:hypothetical protein